jgi:hypothetical protein
VEEVDLPACYQKQSVLRQEVVENREGADFLVEGLNQVGEVDYREEAEVE